MRLLRGPVADVAGLETQLSAEVERSVRERFPLRVWLVVTRLDVHAAIQKRTVVASHAVYRREFETGDRDYHPILIELRIGE